jgi:hypothetical protein
LQCVPGAHQPDLFQIFAPLLAHLFSELPPQQLPALTRKDLHLFFDFGTFLHGWSQQYFFFLLLCLL